MEFRNSFSKLKKKVKHRLTGSRPKPNKTGVDVGGSSLDPTSPHPGSEPYLVVGGCHDQEGSGANVGEGQVISTVQLSQQDEPGIVPTHGSANDQERRERDVDKREVEETHPYLHSDAEVVEGSGPAGEKDIDGEKVERLDPSPSTTSNPHDGKPDST